MRIIINEIKKIFNPKMVFLLVLINLIMYFLFVQFYIDYFPNGRPEGDIYKIVIEMKQKYGTHMDGEEFNDFKKTYDEKLKEVNKYIQGDNRFKKCGIKTYKEFLELRDKEFHNQDKMAKKFNELCDEVIFKEGVDLFWEIPERQQMIQEYENRKQHMFGKYRDKNIERDNRIEEILNKGEETSVFHGMIFENYNNLINQSAMTILLSIIFMISPIYIRDKKNKVQYIQYTCKNGRNIFKKKMVSVVISSFIITTIQIIILSTLYIKNSVQIFFDSNINSVFNYNVSWYNITFGQYIVITIIAIYILVFIFTIISLLVSSRVSNYISLIGIQLPIVVITFGVFLRRLVTCIGDIRFNKWLLPICYLCMFSISIIGFWVRWKKERDGSQFLSI